MLLAMFPHIARSGDGGPRILVPLLLLGLIGGLVVWFIRRRRGPDRGGAGSAIETLRDSFARGDIDRAEFEHRRAVLDGADVVPPAPARAATATVPPPPTDATMSPSDTAPGPDAPASDGPGDDDE